MKSPSHKTLLLAVRERTKDATNLATAAKPRNNGSRQHNTTKGTLGAQLAKRMEDKFAKLQEEQENSYEARLEDLMTKHD